MAGSFLDSPLASGYTDENEAQIFRLYPVTLGANETRTIEVEVAPHYWVAALPGRTDAVRVDVWPSGDVPTDAIPLYAKSLLQFPALKNRYVSLRNTTATAGIVVYLYALSHDLRLSGNLWAP